MQDGDAGRPLLRRAVAHRSTAQELVALDALAVLGIAVFAAAASRHQAPRVSGSGWETLNTTGQVVAGLAVLLRHRSPRLALTVMAPIALVVLGLRANGPATFFLPLGLYSVVVSSSRKTGELVAGAVTAAAIIAAVLGGGDVKGPSLTGTTTILLVGWLAGEIVRSRRDYATHQAEREHEQAQRVEAAQAELIGRAIAEERVKIARELHDIVAHAMTVIAVRSGVARMVIDDRPDEAREALSIIETTTRRTLQEMRLLVSMLRDTDDHGVELAPVPGVSDLPGLIHDIEAAGVTVDVKVHGHVRPLPPAADLSAYRILQEALTNVVRHAGPTTARVRLMYQPGAITIAVCDDGPPIGSPRAQTLAQPGAGHGLIGMRERTALFGGTLRAEAIERGFQVDASLRIDD